VRFNAIRCWEATDVNDPMIPAARRVYEETLAPDERIPWKWIEKSIGGAGQANSRRRHLLLAAPEGSDDDPNALAGYAYGSFISGYGGYLCYVGVADRARRMGVGTHLFDAFFRQMAADAKTAGESLPFVVWESHRPGPDAPPADQEVWKARVRLFDRVGGMWVEGVDFLSPNFAAEEGEPVALQVFIKPIDIPAVSFDEARVRTVVEQLHQRIYRNGPGEDLFDGTFPPGCRPRLVHARLAGAALMRV